MSLALGFALVASALLHAQLFFGLSLIKVSPPKGDATATNEPVEIEIAYADPADLETEEDETPAPVETPAPSAVSEREPPRPRPRRRAPPPAPEEEEEVVVEEEEPDPEPAVPVPAVPPPPPPETQNRTVVEQRSQDPEVERPEDARFLAEENSRVEEETVAEITNNQVDQEAPQLAGAEAPTETPELGNADEQTPADLRELEGDDSRAPTPTEARARRPEESDPTPLPNVQARGDTGRTGGAPQRGEGDGSEGGDDGGRMAEGGGERRTITIADGSGTFEVSVPSRPEGEGAGEGGGPRREGSGAGRSGLGRGRRLGTGRLGELGLGRGTGAEGPDLRVSWRQMEEIYSEEQLEEEREAFVEERRSRLRGSNRQQEWQEFRAAIENYVSDVRPGNQTALNAAASPFANYIAGVHRRIHREYAHRFLRGLPGGMTHPFNDRTLNTKLEIILNRDGTVHRVGVVKASGFLPFDQGAFRSVMRGQPYPAPPEAILSGDGRVYLHWGFYRNERQCGTFNAEPFILPSPPSAGAGSRRGVLVDSPEPGGVVPSNAQPTWGEPTDDEEEDRPEPGDGEGDAPAPDGSGETEQPEAP